MAGLLEEFYQIYKKPLYGYFYRATMNSHIAEELTQDTFLRTFRYFSSFRGESSAKTWVFTIARNVFINYLKKKKQAGSDGMDEVDIASDSDDFASLHERMAIRTIMQKLSEEEKTLILLRDANGFTYTEIAKIMNYTEGQVKIGLYRARKKFKAYYHSELNEGEQSV